MKKVLIIEDDRALHGLYSDALANEHIGAISAFTGKEGIEKARKELPDLIVLDIMLPGGIHGFDVAQQLKQDYRLASTPIIVLTNLDSEKQTALAMGAKGYFVKTNTSMSDVVAKIKTLLGVMS